MDIGTGDGSLLPEIEGNHHNVYDHKTRHQQHS